MTGESDCALAGDRDSQWDCPAVTGKSAGHRNQAAKGDEHAKAPSGAHPQSILSPRSTDELRGASEARTFGERRWRYRQGYGPVKISL
jgi:hypothetical protein